MASTATIVRRKIEGGPEDRLWTFRDFSSLPTNAVAKTLSRLKDKGVVDRLRKGVYYRPRTTRFGTTKADPVLVATSILDRKDVDWKPSGLALWNKLGLTTQVPAVSTVAVDRRIEIKNLKGLVRLLRVSSLRDITSEERAALDALRTLRFVPDTTPANTIRRLIDLCRTNVLSFARMTKAARREPPRVRALLGLMGTLLVEDERTLARLRESLNTTTVFKLGLADAFPEAHGWGIR
jgi:Family of unknown function (DUF6088)